MVYNLISISLYIFLYDYPLLKLSPTIAIYVGLSAPVSPTYFFVLTQKSKQKKSRLRPLRSKN